MDKIAKHDLRNIVRRFVAPYVEEAIQLGQRIAESVVLAGRPIPREEIDRLQNLSVLQKEDGHPAPWYYAERRFAWYKNAPTAAGWGGHNPWWAEVAAGEGDIPNNLYGALHGPGGEVAATAMAARVRDDIVAELGAVPEGFEEAVVADRLRREVFKSFAIYYGARLAPAPE